MWCDIYKYLRIRNWKQQRNLDYNDCLGFQLLKFLKSKDQDLWNHVWKTYLDDVAFPHLGFKTMLIVDIPMMS